MIEYMKLLSNYSQNANNAILDILRNFSEKDLFKNHGSFVKSLSGLMNHIAEGEVYFLKQLETAFPKFTFLHHNFSALDLKYNEINFPLFNDLAECVTTCDSCYKNFIESLDSALLYKKININSFDGKKEWTVAFLLLQAITHSTHHRGQISQILDEIGITNNYSGLPELDSIK